MVDMPVTFTGFLGMKIARMAMKQTTKQATNVVSRGTVLLYAFVRLVLHIAGFGALTYGGFTINMTAGLIVGGLSCFVMAKLMAPDTTTQEAEARRAPDLRTGR